MNRQREMLLNLLGEVTPFNAKKKSTEIETLLEKYIPGVEQMRTLLKKYDGAYKQLRYENAKLEKALDASKESVRQQLETAQKLRELEELRRTVENIPPEIMEAYQPMAGNKELRR